MTDIAGESRRKILIPLMLILITLVLYLRVWDYRFINFDDYPYVVENTRVKAGLTMEGISWAFTTLYAGNWHPLTWLSHMLDCQLFGPNPGPHHI
ncbi:MAG: hypothetical protein PHN75_14900, partial [Syntrophales bacterium]|nr:hypothetical protein [Syntrophales bacterium]